MIGFRLRESSYLMHSPSASAGSNMDFRGLKTPRTSVLGCVQKLKVSDDSKEHLGFNPEFFRLSA